MARISKPKIVSKKHVARLKKEQNQRKLIVISAIIIVAAVILVLLYGVFDQTILTNRKPVAKVGETVIRSDKFIKMVKIERQKLNGQAYQYETYKQYFSFDPNNAAYFDSMIQQIQSQMMVPETVGASVLTSMIDTIVISNYAKENNITISDQEIQDSLKKDFGYFPNGTPTPENTATPYSTATLSATQYAMISPTPEPSPTNDVTPTPDEADQKQTATPPTETETVATPFESTPGISETATALPTPTTYTEELFQKNYQTFLENFKKFNMSEKEILQLFHDQLINQKVYEIITANTPTEEEQVWARHILVATEEEANAVLEALRDGEDWTKLAAEKSIDPGTKDQGGDLGWFGRNRMVPEFEEGAYNLNVGEISQPIQSSHGFHIIQLLGKEVRPIDSGTLDQNKQKIFNEWLTAEKEKYTIEEYHDVWTKIVPDTPAFGDYQ